MVGGLSQNDGDGQSRDLPDTSAIDRLIRKTRQLLRSTWVATGLGVSIGLFLGGLILVTLTDLAVGLWPLLRLVGLLVIVVPAAWAFVFGVVRPLFRRLTAVLVARRIEREISGIHNRLVSCVDLARQQRGRFYSQAFHRRLVSEAIERIRGFHPRKVLDLASLRRAGLFTAATVVGLSVMFMIFSARLSTAVTRILHPFADIPPASGVVYEVLVGDQTEPGDYETLRGEDVDFTVVLKKGELDRPGRPDSLRLAVNTVDDEGAAKSLRYEFAELENGQTTFKLTGMQYSFTYRVHGGGTWSKQYQVTMLDRPRIVGLQTILHYPKYMRISEPRLGPPQTADVAGPVESTVEISVDAEGDAVEGEIQLLQPQTKTIDVVNRPERVWFAEEIPQGAKAEGNWQWDEELIGRKAHTHPAADGAHAHGFNNAPVGFTVQAGETLFAYVYPVPDQVPETIMLKWHDGQNWEHRAYWGADKIQEGQAQSAGRRQMGDLPTAGKLVRLEVPAELLDLEGKRLHGVSFTLFGGRCVWGSVGAMPAAQKRVNELAVTEAVLLNPSAASGRDAASPVSRWTGRFPLRRDGFYRVVLRNKLRHPNQQMQEGKLTAILDAPPQVVIERPGTDLLVSSAVKVPIYISAYDDFGIDNIALSLQHGESSAFRGRPVKRFERPKRSETTVTTLDLEAEGLKVGETLQYRVEVRDAKGQSATTQDYTIRIAEDDNAADHQFAQYQEETDTFQEKLIQLIAEQGKVQESVQKLAEKYQPLTKEIERAKVEAAKVAEAETADPDQPRPPDAPEPIELDDESKQDLEQLRGELAQITQLEDQNVELGRQVAADLKQLVEQSPDLQMLPPEIARQLRGVEQVFQQIAVNPMQELSALMKQGTQPQQMDPRLPEVHEQSDRLQQNLEDLQDRLESLAKAQRQSQDDIELALADLQRDLTQQSADLTARELAELRDFMEAMRKELNILQGIQGELTEDNEEGLSDRQFETLLEVQEDFDEEAEERLAQARELLDLEELRRLRRRPPQFPIRPYDPDRDEYLIPPAEQDTEEPEGEAGDQPEEEEASTEKEDEMDGEEEEEMFLPVLGGPIPKLDPRFAEKMRAVAKGEKEAGSDTEDQRREELRSRQFHRLEELDMAEQSLGSDQQTLEELLDRLQSQLPTDALAALTSEQFSQLQELLNAQNTRQARAMFRRLQQMLAAAEGRAEQNQQPTQVQLPTPSELSAIGNVNGIVGGVEVILVELEDLDLDARTVIMKMQPKAREELLQGLREEGPEGYRKFIRNYFTRLTKVQANK